MNTHQHQYDTLLCHYSNQLEAIALLRQYRPYFELIPSLRRPTDSVISLPLPVIKLAIAQDNQNHIQLNCDLALIMCDPDWKVKTGREVFIFIHRPGEDFSSLLRRWRQVEVVLGDEYYWLMPWKHRNLMGDKGEFHYPLFVTLDYTPLRIKRGLEGASLPFVEAEVPEIDAPPDMEEAESAIADQN
ncbi:hypothetical protein V2H45_08790 [Tumidithrix elongata RA019]|uniref:Uncharacterized protein n=1 Tax=Tumidithrix elongata BACA0141 TaxID=2716417 RepID=A0AAW9PRU6_9CYAN|nr:hypothetical protein [Tumidithrix elongata RA019]